MSFTQPDFNLLCNIWDSASGPPAAPRLVSRCNLAFGRRVNTLNPNTGAGITLNISLLLPSLTDIRDSYCAGGHDWVEVPAGSGRLYAVEAVDDAGKGFANEHRVAALQKTGGFGPWPTPIP